MHSFDILNRNLNVRQNYFLEASAGTGKTFSIQNIVVRLLIDSEHPLLISQILIVTFTRAATRELQNRIRENIEKTIQILENELLDIAPDYILSLFEQGSAKVQNARKHLQNALFTFDQAQIFTIHSFCARFLKQFPFESNLPFHTDSDHQQGLPLTLLMSVIYDFFRTEIRQGLYSKAQLAIILKEDPNQNKLLKTIQNPDEIVDLPSYHELYLQFAAGMTKLKSKLGLKTCQVVADFESQQNFYKNYKGTKAEAASKAMRFAALFDKEEWDYSDFDQLIEDGLVWVPAFDPSLLKSKAPQNLHYPLLREQLKINLEPIVKEARCFGSLLARMAKDCRKLLQKRLHEEEKLSPDDFLRKMDTALECRTFAEKVKSSFQAAIIDEFQDTDPIQWSIFRKLFDPKNWNGCLYLVGDPKQSIYSFRKADIYTYLSAKELFDSDRCYSLDTNFRSHPHLVEALNTLISYQHSLHFIPLPKRKNFLPYNPVKASSRCIEMPFQDNKRAIHFFIAEPEKKAKPSNIESEILFPFIVGEIKANQHLAYNQFAVLVKDRFQALQLAEFFEQNNIPYTNQKGNSLAESEALSGWIDVLQAVLHPHDRSKVKKALGTWKDIDLKDPDQLDSYFIQFQSLKHVLIEKGFPFFYQQLLDFLQIDDKNLFHDVQQIADTIIDHQHLEWSTPEGLIPFLDQFQQWDENDDARVKRKCDPEGGGVNILTQHYSKGLEYDVVFALGLIKRTSQKEDLVPIEKDGKIVLKPASEEDRIYLEERDAEKIRQLYVAITRAKYRLYVPVVFFPGDEIEYGEASPLELFLAGNEGNYEEVYRRINSLDGKAFKTFLDEVGDRISYSRYISKLTTENTESTEKANEFDWKAPKKVSVNSKPLTILSYTSLIQQFSHESNLTKEPPHNFGAEDRSIHTLPASNETGILLHEILEKLDFSEFGKAKDVEEAQSYLEPYLNNPQFSGWEKVITCLIRNVLSTPIVLENGQMKLCELKPSEIYREMPFIFPYDKALELEGLHHEEGFIKGVIDLIFSFEGKYYIADWKSNWLGDHSGAYGLEQLQTAMNENHYFLQNAIYMEALQRYLRIVDSRPFEECFGGTLYLFLRGMQPEADTGIFAIKLS